MYITLYPLDSLPQNIFDKSLKIFQFHKRNMFQPTKYRRDNLAVIGYTRFHQNIPVFLLF